MITLLRTLVVGSIAALAWVMWLRMDGERQALVQVASLQRELADGHAREEALASERDAERERAEALDTALRHVKVDTRRARLSVVDQQDGGGADVVSRVRFQELDQSGQPVGEPVEAELPGRVAYVESLVIKFDDELVEAGDPWRGASLCLFRRLFTEQTRPEEGVALDPPGQEPAGYADAETHPADELWRNFWDLADDPAAAAERGVRALHGEAPFVELRDGRSYLVELRASGGLSITREP